MPTINAITGRVALKPSPTMTGSPQSSGSAPVERARTAMPMRISGSGRSRNARLRPKSPRVVMLAMVAFIRHSTR